MQERDKTKKWKRKNGELSEEIKEKEKESKKKKQRKELNSKRESRRDVVISNLLNVRRI